MRLRRSKPAILGCDATMFLIGGTPALARSATPQTRNVAALTRNVALQARNVALQARAVAALTRSAGPLRG